MKRQIKKLALHGQTIGHLTALSALQLENARGGFVVVTIIADTCVKTDRGCNSDALSGCASC
jgi:hypothetical protein